MLAPDQLLSCLGVYKIRGFLNSDIAGGSPDAIKYLCRLVEDCAEALKIAGIHISALSEIKYCDSLRGFCDSFFKTIAALFDIFINILFNICEGFEGFSIYV